jgi:uncharacterized membrane protein
MAYCASCGAETQGKFCASCGAPAGNSPPPVASPVAPASASAVIEENVAGALCYLVGVLTGVLFLVIEPYSRNPAVRFHAFQSIFAWIAAMIIGMVLSTVGYVIGALPFIGWLLNILLWLAFSLGVVVLWLLLMFKAYNKERFVLPVIGPWAEKQAQSL